MAAPEPAPDLLRLPVLQYAWDAFGTRPEYLWEKYPGYAVLRRGDTRKWYGLVMEVPRARLKLPGPGAVWVLNVKCSPLMTGGLRRQEGILPAYHMNKAAWLTVLLDGTLPLPQVTALLDLSHQLTGPGPKAAPRAKTGPAAP